MSDFISRLVGWLKRVSAPSPAEEPNGDADDVDSDDFVFVKIPEAMGAIERGDRYEDPLDEILQRHTLGEVTGGGTQFGEMAADVKRGIEYCGIDIEMTEITAGLAVLRDALVGLGAPTGTEIEYLIDGNPRTDELTNDGWKIGGMRADE